MDQIFLSEDGLLVFAEKVDIMNVPRVDSGEEVSSCTLTKVHLNQLNHSVGAYIDKYGFLRVKGRMEYSDLECMTPILLRSRSNLTDLVISEVHSNVLHYGMKDTLNEGRAEYWIPRGRAKVKGITGFLQIAPDTQW